MENQRLRYFFIDGVAAIVEFQWRLEVLDPFGPPIAQLRQKGRDSASAVELVDASIDHPGSFRIARSQVTSGWTKVVTSRLRQWSALWVVLE